MHFLLHMRSKGVEFEVHLIDDGNTLRNQAILQILEKSRIKVSLSNSRRSTDSSAVPVIISNLSTKSS
jgi:hypothetical protein